MNSLWDLISELFAPLLGGLIDHKISGKKIQWGRIFRLLGVGFLGVAILIFIFIYFAVEKNVSGAILCAMPFFIIGAAFTVIEIIRKNNT